MTSRPVAGIAPAPLPARVMRTLGPAAQRLRSLIASQDGVITRGQIVQFGLRADLGRDQVRHGRWRLILGGVYLANSGRVTFRHRCWAAHLAGVGRAVVTGDAAAYLDGILDRAPERIEVVVEHGTRLKSTAPWLVARQTRTPLPPPSGRPLRTSRWFTAIWRTQSARSEDEVVAILTETARSAGTSEPLRAEAARWPRLRWRAVIEAVLAPEEEGHESVLEWTFTRRVLRCHGLPTPKRQQWQRVGTRRVRVDGVDETWGLQYELDGRIHEGKTEDDIWRDNETTVTQRRPTLRFRWRHVIGRSCESAELVERGYRMRGWPDRGRPCGPSCPVGR